LRGLKLALSNLLIQDSHTITKQKAMKIIIGLLLYITTTIALPSYYSCNNVNDLAVMGLRWRKG